MKRKIKIWHAALLIWLVLILLRNDKLMNTFIEPAYEIMAEFILLAMVPIAVYCFRKYSFLNSPVKFYNLIGLLLFYMFLFPGVISDTDPDFRRDLSVTRLLPPLSKINVLHYDGISSGSNIIFIDSLHFHKSWVYYQKQKSIEISESKINFNEGSPLVTTRIFVLGTDVLGRDVFARLVFGVRTSLLIGICAALVSFFIGVLTGFIAGYYEGFAGIIFSRVVDVLLSFPVVILIILTVALFGNSLTALVLILGFTGWMGLFKIVRSEVIILRTKDFFITSKLMGLTGKELIIKEALPVFIIPALTNVVFQINNVIIAESSLSYLGLGVENIYPSWGSMIQSGQEYMNSAWWLMFFPALMIVLTLQSIKGFGNAINSYFNPGIVND